MNNIKVFKSNDFFKFPNKEDNDNRRIYDLGMFYRIKYNNSDKNVFNYKNYINLKKDFNNNNYINKNINLNNRNYILENDNGQLDPILSNDIEAENNIGKYKEKILNRAKIIEQNYKRFNQYQNTRYNIIDKCNYDSFSSLNRKNNNGLIIKTPNKKIYYLDTNNSRLGRKLNNSVSSKNNLKINFYLSDFSNEKIYNNKEYMGKKRTDITNNDYINITDNNDNGFYDYCQKKIEILLNNKKMVEDKEKQKKN